jgi:DEAD/DEAH box helicase domain-containing protein
MKNLNFDFSGGKSDVLVLDVETQYLSEEVPGGWNAVEKFGVALVVTWDEGNGMRLWYEQDVPALLADLQRFDPIVTFNGENFDFRVLSAYGSVQSLYRKSRDMLVVLNKSLGFRVSLDAVAQATLGRGKTGSGKASVGWWRSGDRQKVIDYCKQDVELTRDVYLFGRAKGYVSIDDLRHGGMRRVEVSW